MKAFEPVQLDFAACRAEVGQFAALLAAHKELPERKMVLPFFRNRRQLSALCGAVLFDRIARPDRLAWEYDLFGDFACDLVVGDWANKSFSFVEFEDATPRSLFVAAGKRATRDWSPRFEHGYSQAVDWIHKLGLMTQHADFEARFGKRAIEFNAALVVGRSADLTLTELGRLEWRRQHVVVGSRHINCVTFDELLGLMQTRLDTYAALGLAPEG